MLSLPVLIGRGLDLDGSHSQARKRGFGAGPGRAMSGHFSCAVFRMRRTRKSAEAETSPEKSEGRLSRKRRGRGPGSPGRPRKPKASPENVIRFPVAMAGGSHLFPFRTQKLSLHTLMVLGWRRPGRVGRCRIPFGCWRSVRFSNIQMESGSDLLSRAVSSQVPSACGGLTSVFGMGTGGTLQP